MLEEITGAFQGEFLWVVVAGLILAFFLGAGQGANDVSNAFATSVGSGVLKLRTAYILATIFETLGTVLVGYQVTDAVRKAVVDLDVYKDKPNELLLGQLAILGGSSIWLAIATALNAPVSTTHSVVGSTLGFTLLLHGTAGIEWGMVGQIVLSWVISPLMAGTVAAGMYVIVDHAVLRRRHPVRAGLRTLPFIYLVCIAFNTFAVTYDGSKLLHLDSIPLWLAILLSIGMGVLVALVFQFFLRNRLERKVNQAQPTAIDRALQKADDEQKGEWTINGRRVLTFRLENGASGEKNAEKVSVSIVSFASSSSDDLESNQQRCERRQEFGTSPKQFVRWFLPDRERREDIKTLRLFGYVQIFTACFAGFAHGANDVSNAVAPLVAIFAINREHSVEQKGQTPLLLLLYGVLATLCGLWLLGHRVIRTVGSRMSTINPATGFIIEFGAAVTTLFASKIGIPISTTHCLIGAVVMVGCVSSRKGIDWSIFRQIALSWVITLPVSAAISAAIMLLLKWIAL
ncbi:Phosphate transporter [Aphelenchoides fujianensis]|nr:Phosphate transporter [Aphelenchoides fujianensis]